MIIQSHPLLDQLVDAYNSQDMTGLLSCFTPDTVIYEHPSQPHPEEPPLDFTLIYKIQIQSPG